MIYKFKISILILFFTVLFMSCESFDTPQGTLVLKVLDGNYSPAKNADIYLYNNETDMLNDSRKSYAWQITDTSGVATFKRIEVQTYWISCKVKNSAGDFIKITDSVTVLMDTTINLEVKP